MAPKAYYFIVASFLFSSQACAMQRFSVAALRGASRLCPQPVIKNNFATQQNGTSKARVVLKAAVGAGVGAATVYVGSRLVLSEYAKLRLISLDNGY